MSSSRFHYSTSADGQLIRTMKREGDNVILHSAQDCEPIVKANALVREVQKSFGYKGEIFRKIASVPVHVYERAVREGWVNDEKAWAKWMNDGDNRDFRVWEGRI